VDIAAIRKKRLQPVDDIRADAVIPALGVAVADDPIFR
jgi:hypothetical protein